jgi:hypothetical protein
MGETPMPLQAAREKFLLLLFVHGSAEYPRPFRIEPIHDMRQILALEFFQANGQNRRVFTANHCASPFARLSTHGLEGRRVLWAGLFFEDAA